MLNNYTVSAPKRDFLLRLLTSLWRGCVQGFYGFAIFLYETFFQFDHLILLIHIVSQAISGSRETSDYSHVIFIAITSIVATGCLNYLHDKKLRQAAEKVNSKPVEKFIFSKRHKSF